MIQDYLPGKYEGLSASTIVTCVSLLFDKSNKSNFSNEEKASGAMTSIWLLSNLNTETSFKYFENSLKPKALLET